MSRCSARSLAHAFGGGVGGGPADDAEVEFRDGSVLAVDPFDREPPLLVGDPGDHTRRREQLLRRGDGRDGALAGRGIPDGGEAVRGNGGGPLAQPHAGVSSGWCGRPRHGVGDGFVVVAEDEARTDYGDAMARTPPAARRSRFTRSGALDVGEGGCAGGGAGGCSGGGAGRLLGWWRWGWRGRWRSRPFLSGRSTTRKEWPRAPAGGGHFRKDWARAKG